MIQIYPCIRIGRLSLPCMIKLAAGLRLKVLIYRHYRLLKEIQESAHFVAAAARRASATDIPAPS